MKHSAKQLFAVVASVVLLNSGGAAAAVNSWRVPDGVLGALFTERITASVWFNGKYIFAVEGPFEARGRAEIWSWDGASAWVMLTDTAWYANGTETRTVVEDGTKYTYQVIERRATINDLEIYAGKLYATGSFAETWAYYESGDGIIPIYLRDYNGHLASSMNGVDWATPLTYRAPTGFPGVDTGEDLLVVEAGALAGLYVAGNSLRGDWSGVGYRLCSVVRYAGMVGPMFADCLTLDPETALIDPAHAIGYGIVPGLDGEALLIGGKAVSYETNADHSAIIAYQGEAAVPLSSALGIMPGQLAIPPEVYAIEFHMGSLYVGGVFSARWNSPSLPELSSGLVRMAGDGNWVEAAGDINSFEQRFFRLRSDGGDGLYVVGYSAAGPDGTSGTDIVGRVSDGVLSALVGGDPAGGDWYPAVRSIIRLGAPGVAASEMLLSGNFTNVGMDDQQLLTRNVAMYGISTPPCPGDVNSDGYRNGADLTALMSSWGSDGVLANTDFNDDGTVNGSDLTAFLSAWGACPLP